MKTIIVLLICFLISGCSTFSRPLSENEKKYRVKYGHEKKNILETCGCKVYENGQMGYLIGTTPMALGPLAFPIVLVTAPIGTITGGIVGAFDCLLPPYTNENVHVVCSNF